MTVADTADAADAVADEAEAADAADSAAAMVARAKCPRQSVLTADRNAKCPSSRPKEGRCTAGNASRSTRSSSNGFSNFLNN